MVKSGWVLGLTFPDCDNVPTLSGKPAARFAVPHNIGAEFFFPEHFTSFRRCGLSAPGVSMPEAPVDEDRGAVA
jgi:hypothetical protein